MTQSEHLAVSELLPLSPLVFHILLSLSEGERHGYALKREVARRTGGAINPGPGVLYSTISKMVDMGVIEESDERPDPHLDDERRRYYRITMLGRRAARAEAIRMRELVEMAAERFGLPGTA
jgi:DNA-binding PadR family transcriptional regulator